VSPTPPRRPDAAAGPPRWLLVMLSAGISLLVAVVFLLLLQAVGVDRISSVGFVAVIVVAALAGGWLTRQLAPRLPDVRRPPKG
jgi:membrane protein YdbS with pleckstrin-like domain